MPSFVEEISKQQLKCDELLKLAHEAPLNPYRLDANGHRWVEQYSTAWSNRSHDYLEACKILEKLKAFQSDFVKSILDADAAEPETKFNNSTDMMEYLNSERS